MTPIFQTSTFKFSGGKAIEDYTMKRREHFEYGRYGNPTAKIAEERLADLEDHPHVKRVYYPFLKSHPHHNVAIEQMAGGGGVVTFDIKGDINTAKRFLDALELCYIGPRLGGVETLITHPALVSYYDYKRKER